MYRVMRYPNQNSYEKKMNGINIGNYSKQDKAIGIADDMQNVYQGRPIVVEDLATDKVIYALNCEKTQDDKHVELKKTFQDEDKAEDFALYVGGEVSYDEDAELFIVTYAEDRDKAREDIMDEIDKLTDIILHFEKDTEEYTAHDIKDMGDRVRELEAQLAELETPAEGKETPAADSPEKEVPPVETKKTEEPAVAGEIMTAPPSPEKEIAEIEKEIETLNAGVTIVMEHMKGRNPFVRKVEDKKKELEQRLAELTRPQNTEEKEPVPPEEEPVKTETSGKTAEPQKEENPAAVKESEEEVINEIVEQLKKERNLKPAKSKSAKSPDSKEESLQAAWLKKRAELEEKHQAELEQLKEKHKREIEQERQRLEQEKEKHKQQMERMKRTTEKDSKKIIAENSAIRTDFHDIPIEDKQKYEEAVRFRRNLLKFCGEMENTLKENGCIPCEVPKKNGFYRQSIIELKTFEKDGKEYGSVIFHHGGEALRYNIDTEKQVTSITYNTHAYAKKDSAFYTGYRTLSELAAAGIAMKEELKMVYDSFPMLQKVQAAEKEEKPVLDKGQQRVQLYEEIKGFIASAKTNPVMESGKEIYACNYRSFNGDTSFSIRNRHNEEFKIHMDKDTNLVTKVEHLRYHGQGVRPDVTLYEPDENFAVIADMPLLGRYATNCVAYALNKNERETEQTEEHFKEEELEERDV